jgi:CheY-like chemotaxis protein
MKEALVYQPLRVLVVDDNVDTADSLALLLSLWGHEAAVAYHGQATLSAALIHQPDVVLLDLALPGMDGYRVAEELGKQGLLNETVLIAHTGYLRDEDRRRTRDAGFAYHLGKPVEPKRLQELLCFLSAAKKGRRSAAAVMELPHSPTLAASGRSL